MSAAFHRNGGSASGVKAEEARTMPDCALMQRFCRDFFADKLDDHYILIAVFASGGVKQFFRATSQKEATRIVKRDAQRRGGAKEVAGCGAN